MSPHRAPIVILLLAMAGAACGYAIAPFLARQHNTVQVAARVSLEDSRGLETRTLASEAWRETGQPAPMLYKLAAEVQHRIRLGAVLFGVWCGLVVGCKLFAASRIPREDTYHIDHTACVACARCFLSCPREHRRLKELRGQPPADKEG